MGCRTRVMGNVYDRDREISYGRGNLSFTSINLPRIAIKSNGNLEWFFEELQRKMDLCAGQMLDRYAIQAAKKVKNFPFLMGQGVWIDSEKAGHGGYGRRDFEARHALHRLYRLGRDAGCPHWQAPWAERGGAEPRLEIVHFMRDYVDNKSKETGMNFTLLATPAEGLSGRFVRMDKKKFGEIAGVTDREYYTNSFHVPVYYNIGAFDKIKKEAPYHALTNAGHISYVELDGDTANNVEAFESVIRAMKEAGVGYGSVNHPVDRDPECGYCGIINDECPRCGRKESEDGTGFERIRRITGYLVGTVDRFNNAKRAEEKDRVKHSVLQSEED